MGEIIEDTKNHICKCQLKNRQIVDYDCATKDNINPNPEVFYYLGEGVIWSINDVLQKSSRPEHFWAYK